MASKSVGQLCYRELISYCSPLIPLRILIPVSNLLKTNRSDEAKARDELAQFPSKSTGKINKIIRDPYQYFLESVDTLVGHGHAVNLANLIADVERCLPMNHASMHDARHDAASVFRHLERDALEDLRKGH